MAGVEALSLHQIRDHLFASAERERVGRLCHAPESAGGWHANCSDRVTTVLELSVAGPGT